MSPLSFCRAGSVRPWLLAAATAATALTAAAVVGDFEHPASTDTAQQFAAGGSQRQDTPNDPGYDCAELDTQQSAKCTNLYDERFDLFGFASGLTRATALYADPTDAARAGKPQISGFNAAGAWKAERGRGDVAIAILDTGVRWEHTELRTQVRLNCGELPAPRDAGGRTRVGSSPKCLDKSAAYDLNGNGAFDVDDYALDARVNKNGGPTGVADQVDGQDLIQAFSDRTDADGNGYVDDIAGWDFFDDDNDPYDKSSYFAAANHGSGRTAEAIERGNDGAGEIGVCPHCQFVPIRVWDTFVSDADTFGLGVTYAADNGIQVIEGADGGLYHPAFAEAAVNYAHAKGAVMTFSGNDLNTGNHNYPAAYNHVLLIQGTVPDSVGLGTESAQFQQARAFFCQGPLAGMCPGSNVPTGTYFRGANTTQFGGKSSIAMEGPTGSTNTGKAAGAAALVVAAGLDYSPGLPLSPSEVRELLEQTAEDVTQPNTVGAGSPDFAQAGWDVHFGYGRANLGAAVQAVKDSNIPPEAELNSPDWYAPLTGASVRIGGLARARRAAGGRFHYKLEWAAGVMPSGAATNPWTTVAEADAGGPVTDFGSIDLAAVRAALAGYTPPADLGDATFAPGERHPLQDQFTVRLTVTDPARPTALKGMDRKVLTAVPDGQNLVAGFPLRLGSGGEAPLRYADLDGDGKQELIVPTEDGLIHALLAAGGELPGWPVRTLDFARAANHARAPAFLGKAVALPGEPPRAPTLMDLDGDGRLWVVTAAGTHVYAFGTDGKPHAGFPVAGDPSFCTPDKQKQPTLHPKCGFLASPAMARLDGVAKGPSIVVPGMDGRLYAWHADGTPVAWSPKLLSDAAVAAADRQVTEAIASPAIGDLNNDGVDDIVAATNEAYDDAGGAALPSVPGAPSDVSFGSIATKSTRVYAIDGKSGGVLAGWPVHVSGIIQNVLPFIGPSADPVIATINGTRRVVLSATGTGVPGVGSGLATYGVDGTQAVVMRQDGHGPASNITDTSGGINLFESAVVGNLSGVAGAPLSVVKYQLGVAAAANLLLVGQNVPYNHMIGAWNAQTGTTEAAFPRVTEDYQFLSSSGIAKVVTGTSNQIVSGTGLGLLHAFDGVTGLDVTGFPKVTGGWLFAPAAVSDDGRMAAITREGFLFQWTVGQPACQTEWPSFRHDQQGSGSYDRDGTPPAAVGALAATRAASSDAVTLAWTDAGDDGRCGIATRTRVALDGVEVSGAAPTPGAAGTAHSLTLGGVGRADAHRLVVQEVDEAGNLGFPATALLDGTVKLVFARRTNVPTGAFVSSETISLAGFYNPLKVQVAGAASSQYSVNGGPFTSEPGQVKPGDTLTLRHISATTPGTETGTVVTVGEGAIASQGRFVSVTTTDDPMPDAFDFGTATNQALGAWVESPMIVPQGFNVPATVVAGQGQEYRIGSGAFTSASGRLQPGQSIGVRQRAATTHLAYTKSTLRIGGVGGSFVVRAR